MISIIPQIPATNRIGKLGNSGSLFHKNGLTTRLRGEYLLFLRPMATDNTLFNKAIFMRYLVAILSLFCLTTPALAGFSFKFSAPNVNMPVGGSATIDVIGVWSNSIAPTTTGTIAGGSVNLSLSGTSFSFNATGNQALAINLAGLNFGSQNTPQTIATVQIDLSNAAPGTASATLAGSASGADSLINFFNVPSLGSTIVAVPEPSSLALVGVCLMGTFARRKRAA